MKKNLINIGLPVLGLVIVLLIWAAPIGPVPGFFIGGAPTAIPASWGETLPIHEVRLKVPGDPLPRVVVIWFIQVDGQLHVVGNRGSGWVEMIGEHSPVELRIEDKTYAMTATAMRDNRETIVTAYQDKYRADYPDIVGGFPSMEEASDTVAVFRLSAG